MTHQVNAGGAVPSLRHVLLLSFVIRPHPRVTNLARQLLDRKVRVDLLVINAGAWAELAPHPLLRIHSLDGAEHRHPVRRLERVVVHRLPAAALGGAARLAGTGPLAAPLGSLQRGHGRLAETFHHRVYMRAYGIVRPWLLARLFRAAVRSIDLGDVDRIIASDILTVTLGWRLARRVPSAVATTSIGLPADPRTAAGN